jgi:hypothetical protein
LGAILLFDRNFLILVGIQCAGGIRLLAQGLNRRHHRFLVRFKCCSQRSVVINVDRHHVKHRRKAHERDEGWIESFRLRGVGQRCALQVRVLFQPVVCVDNLLRVGRSRTYLRKQCVGIERDRSQ